MVPGTPNQSAQFRHKLDSGNAGQEAVSSGFRPDSPDPSALTYSKSSGWSGAVVILLDCTQYMSSAIGDPLRFVVLRPIIYAAWVMVWWNWFGLRRPAWLPRGVALLGLFCAVSTALARNLLVFTTVPHAISAAFDKVCLAAKLLFLPLTLVCIIQGIRRRGSEGWSLLPAVLLWGVAQFWEELNLLHIYLTWFPFGVQITFGDVANLLLAFVIGGLLLRRLFGGYSANV